MDIARVAGRRRSRSAVGVGIGLAFAMGALAQPVHGQSVAGGRLVAANKDEASVSIIDPRGGGQLAKIVEGDITAHEVAASADGRFAYLPIYGNSSVGEAGSDGHALIAVDLASARVVGRLDFGHPVRPHGVFLNPRDGLLYVTAELDHAVDVIDPATLKIVGAIPTGQTESHMVVLSHDGRFGYTANVGPGTVSVLDIQSRKLISIIPVSKQTERIAISTDDRMVFTADQETPRLAVIDTANNTVRTWIRILGTAYGIAATHDGRWLLAAMPHASKVAVIDLKTLEVAHTIDTPPYPVAVIIAPNGKAYVSCSGEGKIAEIDLTDFTITRIIQAGNHVDGLAWAAN